MIDGYKILNLPVSIDELLNNELLLFPLKFNELDGVIIDEPRTAEYKGQYFTIKNNNVKLKGSLHKYHNNGSHNYNDFNYLDLTNVIFDLSNKFNLNPGNTYLNNLEFGVNILIPVKPEEFFKYVINYKGTPFQKFNIIGAKGIECIMSNFVIKMYDKGHQYNQPGKLLRFEIKVFKMQYLKDKKINIKTLADLLNIDELNNLKRILKDVFNDILIYDYSINQKNLNAKERLILSQGNNPKYWEKLKPDSKNFENDNKDKEYKKQRKKYYRELNNFKKLISKYSTSTLQKDISNLSEQKCNQLLNIEGKKGDKLTDLFNNIQHIKKGQINISNIVSFCPKVEDSKPRICLTCKTDISNKKKSAKFCSKKCKNDYTNPLLNPKNNLLRRIEKINSYPLLFDNSEFIILSAIEKELLIKTNSIYQ